MIKRNTAGLEELLQSLRLRWVNKLLSFVFSLPCLFKEIFTVDPSVTCMMPSSSLKNEDPSPSHFLITRIPWKQRGSPKCISYLPESKEIHICSVGKQNPLYTGQITKKKKRFSHAGKGPTTSNRFRVHVHLWFLMPYASGFNHIWQTSLQADSTEEQGFPQCLPLQSWVIRSCSLCLRGGAAEVPDAQPGIQHRDFSWQDSRGCGSYNISAIF